MRKILFIIIGLSVSLMADFVRDAGTNIVSDNATGLQWQDDAIGASMAWQSAIDACENLTLGGHSDWRLPNVNELKTIIDRSRVNPVIVNAFVHTSSSDHWSSTTASDKFRGLTVNLYRGSVDYDNKRHTTHVRCVRAGQ